MFDIQAVWEFLTTNLIFVEGSALAVAMAIIERYWKPLRRAIPVLRKLVLKIGTIGLRHRVRADHATDLAELTSTVKDIHDSTKELAKMWLPSNGRSPIEILEDVHRKMAKMEALKSIDMKADSTARFLCDLDMDVLFVNPSYCRLTKSLESELVGPNWKNHIQDQNFHDRLYQAVENDVEYLLLRTEIIDSDGDAVPVKVSMYRYPDGYAGFIHPE